MAKKSHNTGKLALGGLILASISYVAGILTAPKSGKQTRKDIKDAAVKARMEAEKKLKKAHSELNDLVDEAKSKGTKAKKDADTELKKAITQAEKVKQKSREILSAVHEGEAQNKDLDMALQDVKQAAKHLKTFLKK